MSDRVVLCLGVTALVLLAGWLLWFRGGDEGVASPVPVTIQERTSVFGDEHPDSSASASVSRNNAPATPPTRATSPDALLSGQVVDSRQQGVVEARVAAYSPNFGAARTVSDAGGYFEFSVLKPAPEGYRVSARKEPYSEAVETGVVSGRHDIVLVLEDLSAAAGVVVEAGTGRPVEKFSVVAIPNVPGGDSHWRRILTGRKTHWKPVEDPRGHFELDEVVSRKPFAIAARAEGYEAAYAVVAPIDPGQTDSTVRIELGAEARIEGVVVSPSGEPVEGATVYIGKDVEGDPLAWTDADGQFLLTGLGEGPLTIGAAHPEYLPGFSEVHPLRRQTAQVRVALGQGGRVEGTVTRGGAPRAGLKVVVSRLMPPRFGKRTATDTAGHYAVDGVVSGEVEVMAVLAGDQGFGTAHRLSARARVEPGCVTTIDFDFPTFFSSVAGTITVNGAVPESAEIRGTLIGAYGDEFISVDADEGGAYSIPGLSPGIARLAVAARTASGSLRRASVELEVGEGVDLRHDIALDGANAVFGTVDGLKRGEAGEVLAVPGDVSVDTSDLQAMLALEDLKTGSCELKGDGAYYLEGLSPGAYTLLVIAFSPDGDILGSARVAEQGIEVKKGEDLQVDFSLE